MDNNEALNEVLSFGKFNRAEAERTLSECNGDVKKTVEELINRSLQPVIERVWNAIKNPSTENDQIPNKVRQTVQDRSQANERRIRMLYWECDFDDYQQAANAIAIIDDQEFFSRDVTLEEVLATVKTGPDDPEKCKKRLKNTCGACTDLYRLDELHTFSTFCNCVMCADCFKENFKVVIKEKAVVEWRCPLCQKPENEEDLEMHFQFLENKISVLLDKELVDLFNRKLTNWNLQKDPNFVWCANNQCNNGFIKEGNRKTQCPHCKQYMCWECRKLWEEEHGSRSCRQFAEWKEVMKQEQHIKDHMLKETIECPSCRFPYELMKGGCLHFKCTNCSKQFCGGCRNLYIKDQTRGLNCNHPRDCWFYMRQDHSIADIQKLLKNHSVSFASDSPKSTKGCPIEMLKEVDGKTDDKETPCGDRVVNNHHGLCKIHYKEYLVNLMNKNKVDPLEIMNIDHITTLLMRENIQFDDQDDDTSDKDYLNGLKEKVKQNSPLKNE